MPTSLRTVAHSEIGLVRKNNQDSGYASPTMIVVADGMGGAAAGDLASAVAINELRKADGHQQGEAMLETLAGALQRANDRLAELVADDHSLDGMGTTVCGAMFDGEQLGIIHIGDSRGYLRRDGKLQRLTHDHSWVQSLVDDGRISEAESLFHPHKSLLLKVLNGQPLAEADLGLVEVHEGDRILFCSDGLCGLVTDDVIDAALAQPDREQCLAELIAAAHAGGGHDNITIIVSDAVACNTPAPPREDDEDVVEGESTVIVPGRSVGAGLLLGAAVDREIPALRSRPIDIDGPTGDVEHTDESGNFIPDAPTPGSPKVAQLAPAEAEEATDEPEAAERRRRPRAGVWIAVLAVVLALALGSYGTYAYASTQFFIAPATTQVGIYRGIPGHVVGLSTNRLVEPTGIEIADLPPSFQQRVRNGIVVRDGGVDAARQTVAELRLKSEQCIKQRLDRAVATQSPTPTPSPTVLPPVSPGATPATPATPGATLTETVSATPSATPTPSASPSPSSPEEC